MINTISEIIEEGLDDVTISWEIFELHLWTGGKQKYARCVVHKDSFHDHEY